MPAIQRTLFATCVGEVGIRFYSVAEKVVLTHVVLPEKLGGRSDRSQYAGDSDLEKTDSRVVHIVDTLMALCAGRTVCTRHIKLDMSALSAFQKRVYAEQRQLQSGAVLSYGALAKKIGNPGATRAVASAQRKNPFPLLVPCHRIITASGEIGSFQGGKALKAQLLMNEGVVLEQRGSSYVVV